MWNSPTVFLLPCSPFYCCWGHFLPRTSFSCVNCLCDFLLFHSAKTRSWNVLFCCRQGPYLEREKNLSKQIPLNAGFP